jgi:hypothetical protein
MPVVLAHSSLVSQLVVLPLSGQHRPAHTGSLPQNGTQDIYTAGDVPLYFLQNQPRGV